MTSLVRSVKILLSSSILLSHKLVLLHSLVLDCLDPLVECEPHGSLPVPRKLLGMNPPLGRCRPTKAGGGGGGGGGVCGWLEDRLRIIGA